MEYIKKAVERARVAQGASLSPEMEWQRPHSLHTPQPVLGPLGAPAPSAQAREVLLDGALLKANRIISHDHSDPRSRAFDMLRTQVLQAMDLKGWRLLAVTSATPACGKTLVSLNLAMSIARQSERSLSLIDLDIQKAQVAKTLGKTFDDGVLSVLLGRSTLTQATVEARVGPHRFRLLPCERPVTSSSEWMSSRAMSQMLQELKADPGRLVILDLPPILSGDDVLSVLPLVDCVLFVTAIGTTTIADIKESTKHLENVDIVRIVVNKASEKTAPYYY